MARTRLYRDGSLAEEDFPVGRVAELAGTGAVWVDLTDHRELAELAEHLDLHELAVEDAGPERQRPKLDRYDSHFFLTAYCVALDGGTGRLRAVELSAFVTPQVLVTVHSPDFDTDAVVARWDGSPQLAASGVGFLLHGLLDHVVDSHFDVLQALEDHVERLEDTVFTDRPDEKVLRRALRMRRSLVSLRRLVTPMREVVGGLMHGGEGLVDRRMTPYYQDVYDHVLRAAEWADSLRDLVATVRETQLSIQGNRLNLIMKRVTGWAAVIAVPTAVTGYFGQNVPFPGTGATWGFWVSTAALALSGTGLYLLFKRRDWL